MFNQKRYEQAEDLVLLAAIGLIDLNAIEFLCAVMEYDKQSYEKELFLEGE